LDAKVFTEENAIFGNRGKPPILFKPLEIPGAPPVAAGTDHSFALTRDGKAYSCGFFMNGRTGLGTEDDVETLTPLTSKSIREKKLIFAGAGGSYFILASAAGAS
jgi:regulator of chromosome condensation